MDSGNRNCKVCVTGGSGYIGSFLIKHLLQNGYTVHATLRNLDDKTKTSVIQSLPDAATRLILFQADIYNPSEFQSAINGCEFVFHVATPMEHTPNSQYKDTTEAAVAGVRSIVDACMRSESVKRLIYTASVMSASPLMGNGSGFKELIDESCWTPLNVPFDFSDDMTLSYTKSKTIAEKEVLSYYEIEDNKLEVVSLACALVGGNTLHSYASSSTQVIFSQITANPFASQALNFLQELLASVPLVHIHDVCKAHIFCIQQPSLKGRFLLVAANPTIAEMGTFYKEHYPEYEIPERLMEGGKGAIRCDATKLTKMGFEYKYDMNDILSHSLECGIRFGIISPQVNLI